MKTLWMVLAVVPLLAGPAAPASAADLGKIDRSIKKQPAYRGKAKYCLLVLGPEARKKVWLVLDGDVLYVDRNGNGDLTEAGEKIAAEKPKRPESGIYGRTFLVRELREGGRRHRNLHVVVQDLEIYKESIPEAKALLEHDPRARYYSVGLEVEMSGHRGLGAGGRIVQSAYWDPGGLLQFGDRPGNAPVIHFGGPWTITPHRKSIFWLNRSNQFAVAIGTPGLGPGTFAYVGYEGVIPDNVRPRAEITFPSRKKGGPRVTAHYDLKDRC